MSFVILGPLAEGGVQLPLCSFKVPAGFPSPAADHIEQQISLDELLNIRAPHVYLVSIAGDIQAVERVKGDRASTTIEEGYPGMAGAFATPPHGR